MKEKVIFPKGVLSAAQSGVLTQRIHDPKGKFKVEKQNKGRGEGEGRINLYLYEKKVGGNGSEKREGGGGPATSDGAGFPKTATPINRCFSPNRFKQLS